MLLCSCTLNTVGDGRQTAVRDMMTVADNLLHSSLMFPGLWIPLIPYKCGTFFRTKNKDVQALTSAISEVMGL